MTIFNNGLQAQQPKKLYAFNLGAYAGPGVLKSAYHSNLGYSLGLLADFHKPNKRLHALADLSYSHVTAWQSSFPVSWNNMYSDLVEPNEADFVDYHLKCKYTSLSLMASYRFGKLTNPNIGIQLYAGYGLVMFKNSVDFKDNRDSVFDYNSSINPPYKTIANASKGQVTAGSYSSIIGSVPLGMVISKKVNKHNLIKLGFEYRIIPHYHFLFVTEPRRIYSGNRQAFARFTLAYCFGDWTVSRQ